MLSTWLIIAAPILSLLAILLFFTSYRMQQTSGIPEGEIIFSDSSQWGKTTKPLYDAQLGLTGKPDYLIREQEVIIPVEVKKTWAPSAPFESHKLQLAAYCLLVKRHFGLAPPFGILNYRNRTFKIPYNKDLEMELLAVMDEIRVQKEMGEASRSHSQKGRCARCGFRHVCDQLL